MNVSPSAVGLCLGASLIACGPQVDDADLEPEAAPSCDPMQEVCRVSLHSAADFREGIDLRSARVRTVAVDEEDPEDIDLISSVGRYLVLLDLGADDSICRVGQGFTDVLEVGADTTTTCDCGTSGCGGWSPVMYFGLIAPYEQPNTFAGTGLLVQDTDDGQMYRVMVVGDDVPDGQGEVTFDYTALLRAPPIDGE